MRHGGSILALWSLSGIVWVVGGLYHRYRRAA